MSTLERMQELELSPIHKEDREMTDVELEQRAVDAMYSSVAANKAVEADIVASQQEFANKVGFFQSVYNNEYFRQDIPRNAKTAVANIAANSLGLVGDLEGLVNNFLPPVFQGKNPSSEDYAKVFGGDPSHPSWLPSAFIAPGPGEVAAGAKVLKSMMVGGVALQRAKTLKGAQHMLEKYPKFKRLHEFEAMDVKPYDDAAYLETGWYKTEADEMPRFMISDADAFVNREVFENSTEVLNVKTVTAGSGTETFSKATFRADQLFTHDDLYAIYPELRGLEINVSFGYDSAGTLLLKDPTVNPSFTGGLSSTNDYVLQLKTYNLSGIDELHTVIQHELQHAVQMIEGFSRGGTSELTKGLVNRYGEGLTFKRILDLIDNDDTITGPVDLYSRMVDAGMPEVLAQSVISKNDRSIRSYIQATLDGDEVVRAELQTAIEGAHYDASNDMAFVIQYLELNEMTDASNIILDRLGLEIGRWAQHTGGNIDEALGIIGNHSYWHLYGEAEARFGEWTRNWTAKQIEELRMAPNPSTFPGAREAGETFADAPLSPGNPARMAPAGQTAIKQFNRDPATTTLRGFDRVSEQQAVLQGDFSTRLSRLLDEQKEIEQGIEARIPMNELIKKLEQAVGDRPYPKLESLERKLESARIQADAKAESAAQQAWEDEALELIDDAMRTEMDKLDIPAILHDDIIEGIIEPPDFNIIKKIKDDPRLRAIRESIGSTNVNVDLKGQALEEELLDDLEGGLGISRDQAEAIFNKILFNE